MTGIQHWHDLATTEVAAVADRDPVVILPLAALEQHGPHLPLSTDLEIGMGLLATAFGRLPADFPA
jgi:creatinine amidohydrolase